ncbi:MAG: hypothetical protein ACHQQ3_11615 [Gemmatimonadales bacterium]
MARERTRHHRATAGEAHFIERRSVRRVSRRTPAKLATSLVASYSFGVSEPRATAMRRPIGIAALLLARALVAQAPVDPSQIEHRLHAGAVSGPRGPVHE